MLIGFYQWGNKTIKKCHTWMQQQYSALSLKRYTMRLYDPDLLLSQRTAVTPSSRTSEDQRSSLSPTPQGCVFKN